MIDYNKILSQRAVAIKPSGIRKFFDIAAEMDDVISLGVGEPDFKTPWSIRHAGAESLEKGRTWYTANAGLAPLRTEIANYLKRRFSLEYDPKNEILVTVGGSEAIDICIRAVINPGDEILLPEPCFVAYAPMGALADAKVIPILFGANCVYSDRGQLLDLSPSRDNIFFYTLGKTMESAKVTASATAEG